MPQHVESISRFRLIAVWLTAAAGLLASADLGILEWKEAVLCHEFRSVEITVEDHSIVIVPWGLLVICQLATIRRSEFGILFYASFAWALLVVLLEGGHLLLDWVAGVGYWMPEGMFCDRWNWFDFTLPLAFITRFIADPIAAALGAATIVGIVLTRMRAVLRP
jgi:hypothetical protein